MLPRRSPTKGHPAAAGIGTNLYLAKVAPTSLPKSKDNIGYLNEGLYKRCCMPRAHNRLAGGPRYGEALYKRNPDMYGVAHYPPELLYRNSE